MMNLLFIPSFMEGNYERVLFLISGIALLYGCVLLATLIDLFFGVRRAISMGVMRTSFGYRRTISKLTSYLGLLFMLTIADIAASIVLKTPYFTLIGAIGIIAVECKSVFENIRKRGKEFDEVKNMILNIYKNKDKIEKLTELFNEKSSINEKAAERIKKQ